MNERINNDYGGARQFGNFRPPLGGFSGGQPNFNSGAYPGGSSGF